MKRFLTAIFLFLSVNIPVMGQSYVAYTLGDNQYMALGAGYYFNRNFALELTATRLDTEAGVNIDGTTKGFAIAGILERPLNQSWAVFGRIAANSLKNEGVVQFIPFGPTAGSTQLVPKKSWTAGSAGVGLRYQLDPPVSVRLMAERFAGDRQMTVISIGFVASFR